MQAFGYWARLPSSVDRSPTRRCFKFYEIQKQKVSSDLIRYLNIRRHQIDRIQTMKPGNVPTGTSNMKPIGQSNSEKRWAIRRSSKSPALIVDGISAAVRCNVTDTSSTGAMLQLDNARTAENLPRSFFLQTLYDRTQVQCEIAWRDEKRVGVLFVSKMQSMPPLPKTPKKKNKPKSLLDRAFGRSN